MPRKDSQRGTTASGTDRLGKLVLQHGAQLAVGMTGHFSLPSVTSADRISFAVTPAFPVSNGRTMGCWSMPGGGFGLGMGRPLYFAVPPLKIQSQPLPRVTAWRAPPRSAHRLPVSIRVQLCAAS